MMILKRRKKEEAKPGIACVQDGIPVHESGSSIWCLDFDEEAIEKMKDGDNLYLDFGPRKAVKVQEK